MTSHLFPSCATLAAASLCVAVAACAHAPQTPAACAQKAAELNAVQATLPGLEAAVETALAAAGGDKAAKNVKDAQAALAIAEALVTADQAYVAASCTAPGAPPVPPS